MKCMWSLNLAPAFRSDPESLYILLRSRTASLLCCGILAYGNPHVRMMHGITKLVLLGLYGTFFLATFWHEGS